MNTIYYPGDNLSIPIKDKITGEIIGVSRFEMTYEIRSSKKINLKDLEKAGYTTIIVKSNTTI